MATDPVVMNGESPQGQRTESARGRWPASAFRKDALVISSTVLVLAIFVYRVLTFVPRPLDSPRTLRPIFYAIFSRFVGHFPGQEQAQQFWASLCMLLLLIPPVLALSNYVYASSQAGSATFWRKLLSSRVLLFTSIAVCLGVCRFPALLVDQINPDETLFIAGAQKLFRDPVFFRALDFVTTGPLNVYPLMLPSLVGVSPDYVSTRLLGLLVILASIYVLYKTYALITGDALGRVAVLPVAGAFASLKYPDFLHCTSEHLSFLLLSGALYCCVKLFLNPGVNDRVFVGLGILAAVAALSKMQAIPILASVIVTALIYVHRSCYARPWWRPAAMFVAGCTPLLLLNGMVCIAAGVWHDFWMEYIVGVYSYTDSHSTFSQESARFASFAANNTEIGRLLITLLAVFAAYGCFQRIRRGEADAAIFIKTAMVGGAAAAFASWLWAADNAILGYVLAYSTLLALFTVAGTLFLLVQRSGSNATTVEWFGFLAAAVFGGAAIAAYVPHRLYGHYLLLFVIPTAIAMAWTVMAAALKTLPFNGLSVPSRNLVSFILAFTALNVVGELFAFGSRDFIVFSSLPATVRAPEGPLIDDLTHPAGEIAVWGWNGRLYLASARVTALKDLTPFMLFVSDPKVRAYYRAGYLQGLQRNPPELFIDAIDTSHGAFANRKLYGFQVIPEIYAFVQSHYVHVLNAYKEGFYIRRDLARTVAGIDDSKKCTAGAIRCFQPGADPWITADLPAIQMPSHAMIRAAFTPETNQDSDATVFSNEGDPAAHAGFRLQHVAGDRYRLGIGYGPEWALSKEFYLPQHQPASLTIEINNKTVTVICNETWRDEIALTARMLDSPGPITVGSGKDHAHPFLGHVQLFEIRSLDLAKSPTPSR